MNGKEALFLVALTATSCSVNAESKPPETYFPTTTESTTSFDGYEECIEIPDASLYIESSGGLYLPASQECVEYVDSIYAELSIHPMFSEYLDDTEVVYNGYTLSRAAKYQEASGILTTGEFDDQTVKSMYHDLQLLENSEAILNGVAAENPANWTRQELSDRLFLAGAFNVKYPLGSAPRTDLLNDQSLTDSMIRELSFFTHWSIINDIKFNLLMVKEGHSQTTLSGNTSDHWVGRAFDIRPYNGDTPMRPYEHDSETAPPLEDRIITHPNAFENGVKIVEYFSQRSQNISQLIWTDSPSTIQNGVTQPNYSRGQAIDRTHHDHIHIAVY